MERMRNTQCITKCYLGYLCYSHEVEKTERLRYSKVKISIRKRPHVTRNCVLHKVVDFLFFLGFSQDINFYPFEDMWGYPEIRFLFPLAPENCNLNNFVWVFLLILSGVFRLSVKYGLSRFLLSLCCQQLLLL